jgi:hypothetical protein
MPVVHNYGSRTVRVHLETGVPPIAERRTYDCITGRRAFLWLVFFYEDRHQYYIFAVGETLTPTATHLFEMWDVGCGRLEVGMED